MLVERRRIVALQFRILGQEAAPPMPPELFEKRFLCLKRRF